MILLNHRKGLFLQVIGFILVMVITIRHSLVSAKFIRLKTL